MIAIDTPQGEAQVDVRLATNPRSTVVLGHGAGGGIDARDLTELARHLPARGVSVVRVVQPWRVAGRKVATPPPTLDVAWLAVLDALALDGPFVVGGRSAGARVACRTASRVGAVGALSLAFPLHPPGRPEKSRLAELAGAGVPSLVLQGDRDPFGSPADFPTLPRCQVRRMPYCDHGMRVPAAAPVTQREVLSLMVDSVDRWLRSLPPG